MKKLIMRPETGTILVIVILVWVLALSNIRGAKCNDRGGVWSGTVCFKPEVIMPTEDE